MLKTVYFLTVKLTGVFFNTPIATPQKTWK